jgi:polysaccharide export outer membrane protein
VRQNAVKVGWPVDVVNNAIESVSAKPAAKPTIVAKGPSLASNQAPKSDEPPTDHAERAPALSAAADTAKLPPPATPSTRPAAVERGVPDDYEIGAGDSLQISVWGEPNASVPSVVVRPDGKISMPLLKEVSVLGLTPIQTEQVITEKLSHFINSADVTVIVTGINSKKIYVVGGVKKEGPIAYTYRMTILQALSEAGGLSDYAKKKKIYVLRQEHGRDYRIPFDYDAALRGEKMVLNVPLLPGDTLVVPK